MSNTSEAAATLAKSGGMAAFRQRQRERITAYWQSPESKQHRARMRQKPIRLGKKKQVVD